MPALYRREIRYMTTPRKITTSNEIKPNTIAIDEMKATTSSWSEYISESVYRFFSKPTDKKSQREDYYQYSNYLAEYWCTLSNVGLFAVGCYYGDFATLAAATFSALSHAIPSQRLHDLDMLGVVGILGKAVNNYDVILKRKDVIATGTAALAINVIDTILTRKYRDKIGPWLHVAWHIAAAAALGVFNQAQLDIAAEKQLNP